MLQAELQQRLLILISLRWHEIRKHFPHIDRMLDPELMSACAAQDFNLSIIFKSELIRLRASKCKPSQLNKLLQRHLERWVVELADRSRQATI